MTWHTLTYTFDSVKCQEKEQEKGRGIDAFSTRKETSLFFSSIPFTVFSPKSRLECFSPGSTEHLWCSLHCWCLKPYVKTHSPDGQLLTLSHQQLSALRTVLTGTRFRTRGCWQTRRQMGILEVSLLFFGYATRHMGSYFLDQGLKPCPPLQQKHRVLTTGLPGESPEIACRQRRVHSSL